MFVSMQIYEFLSKSQLESGEVYSVVDVCLYANIRIFKQITTINNGVKSMAAMFVSMQIYEFLSKSQRLMDITETHGGCLSLCKYTNF